VIACPADLGGTFHNGREGNACERFVIGFGRSGAERYDRRRPAHRAEEPAAERHTDHPDHHCQPDAEHYRLHRCARRALRIPFADAAGDDRTDADGQPHRERINDDQHRLGEGDGRHRSALRSVRAGNTWTMRS